jgi:hypothetical protein
MKKTLVAFIFYYSLFIANYSLGQWQSDVRLTNNNAQSSTSFNNVWCVASGDNNVHVVWFDNRDSNREIYYKRSTDSGINWGADVRLTNDVYSSTDPSIAVSGLVLHVVWEDSRDMLEKLYYKCSTDGGTNWGVDTRLSEDSSVVYSPSICVSGSNVHIVWNDARNGYQVYYKRSTDGGTSWGPDIRLTNSPGEAGAPTISVSGSIIHIAWSDTRDGDEIYYKRSTDNGITWGTDTRLTNAPSFSWQPNIAVSGSLVNVVWADHRNGWPNSEIYYKRSSDAGLNWSDDIRLTNNLTRSWYPSISASGSEIHVVWSDSCDVNYDIFYKRSTDGGLNWEADSRLTNNPSYSSLPSISTNGTAVHLVWYDMRDGNGEIYYKRNPTGNTIGINKIGSSVPDKFCLYQNYPNPFNPTTNIKFKVQSYKVVKLVVFDIRGKEAETLVNGKLKPGEYEFTWDASQYPSGVYFYKLQTDNFTETKKLVLIK